MSELTFTEAFAEYGAKLGNVRTDYSAIAKDGSIVVSCWGPLIKPQPDGIWRYEVADLSEWTSNLIGKDLLKGHLSYALENELHVRLVIAQPKDNPSPTIAGVSGSNIPKTIFTKKNRIGKVVLFDGTRVIIDFRKE